MCDIPSAWALELRNYFLNSIRVEKELLGSS